MTKDEFEKAVRSLFESHGYTKIRITRHLFGMQMDVSAKSETGSKRQFECMPEHKHGKDYVTVKKGGSPDWIDALEAMDAIDT
jgi:hypothetical protein